MNQLPIELKTKALGLRQRGFSLREISEKLNISKSTSSLWLKDTSLNEEAIKRLNNIKIDNHRKTALIWKNKKAEEKKRHETLARETINVIGRDLNHNRVYCALLYWCEGGKGNNEGLRFINSDPCLVKTFLHLLRNAFDVDEEKFHVLMHLHEYHEEAGQKKFWAGITGIPENQFYKTFLKPHSGKRIKDNYPGCVAIYYNDRLLARQIKEIYKRFSD